MENMVHMFGGTQKKSSLVDERILYFPREDEDSPRQAILLKYCTEDLSQFRSCMQANDFNENACLPTKNILLKCAALSFKAVNADINIIF